MAVERAFLVKLLADTSQMTKAFKSVGDEVDKGLSSSFNKVAIASAAAFAGIATFAGKAALAAAEDAAEQERLATSLRNTVGATDEAIAATEEFIASLAKTTTFSDSELRPALDSLVRSTGDLTAAQYQLKLAQDIAAGTGRPLVDVADALAKANAGNMKSLQALSPAIRDNIKDGDSLNEVFQELSVTFGGQAAAQAGTLSGQMQIMRNRFGEVVEEIGQAFLPILKIAIDLLGSLAEFIENNTTTVTFLIIAFGTITGLIVAASIAMKVYTVATAAASAANVAFAASLTATGVGAIVVGIGVLIATLVIAAQKSEGFRKAMVAALNSIIQSVEFLINSFIYMYNKVVLGAINGLSAALKFVGIDLGNLEEISTVSFGRIKTGANGAADAVSRIAAEADAAARRLAQAQLQTGLVSVAEAQAQLATQTARVNQLRAQALKGPTSIEVLNQAIQDQSTAQQVLNTLLGEGANKTGGARKATEEAIKPLEAYTRVLKGAQSASNSYERSTRSLRDAKAGLKDADDALLAAQEALTKAQKAGSSAEIADAQRAVAAAERNVTRGKFDQEQSIFAVRNAEKRLAEVRADSGSTAQDIREAEIALAEAKLAVKDGEDDQIETAKRLETARRDLRIATQGLKEGDEELIPLKDAVTRAQEAQIRASESHADAIKAETEALAEYRIELDKLATAIIEFPKVSANVGQPGLIPIVPAATASSGVGGNGQSTMPTKVDITVDSSIVNPLQVAQEIQDYLNLLNRSYGIAV